MIPELGHIALIVALLLAVCASLLPLLASWKPAYNAQLHYMRPFSLLFLLLVSVSMVCLFWSLIYNDFSVSYVANHSNTQLPLRYRIAALWGGHEGSLLLWLWILAVWTAAVALLSKRLPEHLRAKIISVMFGIAIGFLLFILLTSNPFDRLLPFFPADGKDLNPLLQDFGLIVHPPMLYMGYVGFSVAFAFAIAGLWSGELNAQWARWARPWVLAAWGFLTIGIALGSWWAYYELGWGGWWFWDPVENASFMPWLVGVALLHSLAVADKRDAFKAWTVLLAILSFSLSLLGTFLVRSGVLTSVHAFANDPERGMFILMFLCVVIGGSLSLFAWRASSVKTQHGFHPVSKESMMLINNILLCVAVSCVLIGTIFPLISAAMEWRRVSVGPPYFNRFFVPLALCASVFMGVGPRLVWGRHSNKIRGWMLNVVLSVVLAVLLPYVLFQDFNVIVMLSTGLTSALVFHLLLDIFDKSNSRQVNMLTGFWQQTRSYQGMVVAHLGFAVLILGVCYTSVYSIEKDIRMQVGDTVRVAERHFVFKQFKELKVENYIAQRGIIDMHHNGNVIKLLPEKRFYPVQNNVMTEAAIKRQGVSDIYLSLGEKLEDGAWSMRIYYKPFIRFIWLGAILMALGAAIALRDKRYAKKIRGDA